MRRLPAFLVIVALSATACASGNDSSTPEPTSAADSPATASDDAPVEILNFAYEPQTIEVTAGTTVSWTNQDRFAHTVTEGEPPAADDAWEGVLGDIGEMNAKGTTYSRTFDEAGEFAYFCRFHPNMVGTVVVTG